ncbi:hypothetical protein NDU88_007134 [Pleurodeles waltl]|uniref:Uncharacterized protein n=1 Tax=Pleurodeles waltl TaxID=8319 RepID=A0AAV7VPL2_PLEWA|nr:hypothetical protein NDU88_007134 [Pleurodeles waltl]
MGNRQPGPSNQGRHCRKPRTGSPVPPSSLSAVSLFAGPACPLCPVTWVKPQSFGFLRRILGGDGGQKQEDPLPSPQKYPLDRHMPTEAPQAAIFSVPSRGE